MSYIKPQITLPSPLIFAILNGGSKRRIILADLVSPRGKPAENTRHLSPQDGVGLAHLSNGLWFLDDFSKLTGHLGHVLLDSFSVFKAGYFDVT